MTQICRWFELGRGRTLTALRTACGATMMTSSMGGALNAVIIGVPVIAIVAFAVVIWTLV